jgi:hypothetical protein
MKKSEIYLKAAELIATRRGIGENRMCWAVDEVQNRASGLPTLARKEMVDFILGTESTADLFVDGEDGNSAESDDIRVLALLFAHAEAEYEELPTVRYNATVACSVEAYSDVEVEAKYDWEAIEIAKELAHSGGSDVAWDTADNHRVVEVVREEDDETVDGSEGLYV